MAKTCAYLCRCFIDGLGEFGEFWNLFRRLMLPQAVYLPATGYQILFK